jgi:exopolysaccharide production protein ExoQ
MLIRILPGTSPRSTRSESFRRWPVVLPLALMLASDYKLRSRPVGETVGGSPDLTIFMEIGVYGLAAMFLYLHFGLRPPTRRTTGLLFMGWTWAGYVALSALWTPYLQLGMVRGVQMLVTMAVAQAIATRATVAELHRFAHAFILLVLGSVAIGVVHPFPRTHLTENRFNWLFVHPVLAGAYLALAVLLVMGYLVRRGDTSVRRWRPAAYLGSLAVLAGGLVATGTRGAALGCAAGLVVLLACVNGARGRADLLVIGTATAIVGTLAFSSAILAFVQRGETSAKLATLNSRTDLWSLALKAYAEEPIFGRGLGASRGLFLGDIGLGGGHNAFINTLVDNGAIGTMIFTCLLLTLGAVLIDLARRSASRADAGVLLGILVSFLADAMTTEGLAAPANVSGIWLFVLIAWAEALRRDQRGRSLVPSTEVGGSAPADAAVGLTSHPS